MCLGSGSSTPSPWEKMMYQPWHVASRPSNLSVLPSRVTPRGRGGYLCFCLFSPREGGVWHFFERKARFQCEFQPEATAVLEIIQYSFLVSGSCFQFKAILYQESGSEGRASPTLARKELITNIEGYKIVQIM